MKGWQNQLDIIQKLKRNDDQVQKIKQFENNEYLTTLQINDHLKYVFPQSQCLSMAQLIESIKYNFIKIYKGQLLIIVQQILEHLQKLHQNIQISHGRLLPKNIIIKLKNDQRSEFAILKSKNTTNNKLTILHTKFFIEQIYFVNYRLIDDINYQINCLQDIDDILDCSIELIEAFKYQKCELLQFIVNTLKEYKKDQFKKDLIVIVQFIQDQNYIYIDNKKQRIKNFEKQKTPIIKQVNPKTIKCIEDEKYGILSKRQRVYTLIQNHIQLFQTYDISKEFSYHKQFDQAENDKDNFEELKIFLVFESIIKQQQMRIIWDKYGAFFESWDQDLEKLNQEIVRQTDQNNQQILKTHFFQVLQEFNNVYQITDEIKNHIEKIYKFNIEYDYQKAKDIFILELQIQAQNFDSKNIQILIDQVKSNVKLELQEYYNVILMIEVLNLISDLI
ncbi:unnamed protein product [Paramecium sonneborni]|uniref:Uncharacterized protein n=1 Tax=Paramecium sonneborni TaxID=65129 RepID=A0A8S1QZI6_9CILI|nr:unnamed protein product [Paramecium sonneborni]